MVRISFIIPAFNEAAHIGEVVDVIKQFSSDFAFESEVIVVDNGSTDGTPDIAGSADVLRSIEKNTVSTARNLGASLASNELLAFIDGDVILTRDWFETVERNYDSYLKRALFLTGSQTIIPEHSSWIEKYWFAQLSDAHLGGANMLTTRSTFAKVGGFNEGLVTGEDYDFCLRVEREGIAYFMEKELVAIHMGFPKDLKNFVRREIWHGMGDFVSIKTFLSSPVALLSVFYLFATIAALFSLLVDLKLLATVLVVLVLSLNIMVTVKRFRGKGLDVFISGFLINLIYFFSRSMCLLKATKQHFGFVGKGSP